MISREISISSPKLSHLKQLIEMVSQSTRACLDLHALKEEVIMFVMNSEEGLEKLLSDTLQFRRNIIAITYAAVTVLPIVIALCYMYGGVNKEIFTSALVFGMVSVALIVGNIAYLKHHQPNCDYEAVFLKLSMWAVTKEALYVATESHRKPGGTRIPFNKVSGIYPTDIGGIPSVLVVTTDGSKYSISTDDNFVVAAKIKDIAICHTDDGCLPKRVA